MSETSLSYSQLKMDYVPVVMWMLRFATVFQSMRSGGESRGRADVRTCLYLNMTFDGQW